MAYRDSTVVTVANADPSVAVPSGVQAGDIVILAYSADQASYDPSSYWPSGFTELSHYNNTLDGHSTGTAYKRLTGADSGTYTLGGLTGCGSTILIAVAFSGRHVSNNPVDSTDATDDTGNSSPVTVTANGVTAVDADDLLWVGGLDKTAGICVTSCAPPSGFTECEDSSYIWASISTAYKENVAAGATGTVAGTFTLSVLTAGWVAWVIRIPSDGGGGGNNNGTLVTLTYTANNTWTPAVDMAVTVECWGCGGAGGGENSVNNSRGGGGGGGAYSKNNFAVIGGTTYTINVPPKRSGTNSTGGPGNNVWFSDANNTVYCLAEGGRGGANGASGARGLGGAANNGVGSVKYSGGVGANGVSGANSGGGGGGAGSTGNGGAASGVTRGTETANNGGGGGNGRNTAGVGTAGTDTGGGGSGAARGTTSNYAAGAGANGLLIISYTVYDNAILETGAGSDLISPVAADVGNLADSGTGADSLLSLLSYLGLTELGTWIDAVAVQTGAGTPINVTDTASGSDILSALSALFQLSETGNGTDILSALLNRLALSDSGSGVDTVAALTLISLSDSMTGSDIISAVNANLKVLETGSGTDAVALALLLALSDAGVGTDTLNALAVSFGTLADTGTGTDNASLVMFAGPITDTAQGTDALGSPSAQIPAADTGTGADLVKSPGVNFNLSESGAGNDLLSAILASLNIQDTGAGVDSALGLILITVADSGHGTDALYSLSFLISVSETGTGSDSLKSLSVSVSLVETGLGADTPTIRNLFSLSDVGAGADLISILAAGFVSVSDTMTGTDQIKTIDVLIPILEGASAIEAGPILSAALKVFDSGNVMDKAVIFSGGSRFRKVRVQFQGKQAGVGFKGKMQTVDIAGKTPGVDIGES